MGRTGEGSEFTWVIELQARARERPRLDRCTHEGRGRWWQSSALLLVGVWLILILPG